MEEGEPNLSLTMTLRDPLDISRGDMICRPGNRPHSGQDIDAMVCWFNERPMSMTSTYTIKHTTRAVSGAGCSSCGTGSTPSHCTETRRRSSSP